MVNPYQRQQHMGQFVSRSMLQKNQSQGQPVPNVSACGSSFTCEGHMRNTEASVGHSPPNLDWAIIQRLQACHTDDLAW